MADHGRSSVAKRPFTCSQCSQSDKQDAGARSQTLRPSSQINTAARLGLAVVQVKVIRVYGLSAEDQGKKKKDKFAKKEVQEDDGVRIELDGLPPEVSSLLQQRCPSVRSEICVGLNRLPR